MLEGRDNLDRYLFNTCNATVLESFCETAADDLSKVRSFIDSRTAPSGSE